MVKELNDLPDTVRMALEWATASPHELGAFNQDFEEILHIKSLANAVFEFELTDDEDIMVELFTVLGTIPPQEHAKFLFLLAQKDPEAIGRTFNVLREGNESQRFAYASMVETLGRIGRHSMLINIVDNVEVTTKIEDIISKNKKGGR